MAFIPNLVDQIGTRLNLPELGISEALNGGNYTTNSNIPYIGPESTLNGQPAINQTQSLSAPLGQTPIGPTRPIGPLDQSGNYSSPSGSTGTGSNPYNNVQPPSGPSGSDLNSVFNPILDVYNQAESNLRGQLPGLISEAEAQANASKQLLNNSRTTQNDLLNTQTQRVNQTGQNQTAQQRQLLQELSLANQQRFGGASSAGQAASELQGREFQRSTYGIQQTVQQGLQQIDQSKQQVERDYQSGLQQLEVNKQQAINQLQRTFQDKLLEIQAKRGETESAKASARLEALQTLRNQAYQLNLAAAQFEADLKSQYNANSSYLTQAQQQLLQYGQSGVGAGDQVAAYQATGIPGVSNNTTGSTNPSLTGQISRNPNDQYTGQIGFNLNPISKDYLSQY